MGRDAAVDGFAGVLDDLGRNVERPGGVEPEDLLDGGQLVGTQCRSVDLAGVLLLRARPADDGLQDDQRRLVRDALRRDDRIVQRDHVFAVDAGLLPVDDLHVPVVSLVARLHVLGERDVGVVFDRDLVAVINRNEVAELLVAGERGCLAAHALLEVSVARDHVDEVVERARAGLCFGVEQTPLEAAGVCEAHRRRDALAERTGRDLYAVGVSVLRVTGCERAPGAERLEVLQLQAVAGEVELDVLGQRAVAHRQDEPVAAQPVVVLRVALHHFLEEQVRSRGEAHGSSGMPVADFLNRVRCENSCGVYCLVVNGIPLQSCHVKTDPS